MSYGRNYYGRDTYEEANVTIEMLQNYMQVANGPVLGDDVNEYLLKVNKLTNRIFIKGE